MEKEENWMINSINKRKDKRRAGLTESSIVIPVNISFEVSQKVLPNEQVLEILSNARIIAIMRCECRTNYGKCDAPKGVCIVLDSIAKKRINDGVAKEININDAKQILDETEKAGLVHLIINMEDWQPGAICSCCSCCCHELNALLDFGYLDAVLQSDYIVQKDENKCTNCGKCIEKCKFKAHTKHDDKVIFTLEKCYGCGLCVTSCSNQALKLIKKESTYIES